MTYEQALFARNTSARATIKEITRAISKSGIPFISTIYRGFCSPPPNASSTLRTTQRIMLYTITGMDNIYRSK